MKSDKNGKYNGGTSCGSCHGNKNTATTVALNGLPSSFTPGTTYPLTFTVTNSTLSKAGFNFLITGGTFTAGSGSKVNGNKLQITHSTPMNATSGVTTFSFSWTAPATIAPVTFSAVGNAVNGDNNDSAADQWNTTSTTVSGSFPASVTTVEKSTINCYPNPASDYIIIEGLNAKQISVFNIFGQKVQVNCTEESNQCKMDCSSLSAGTYFIVSKVGNHIATGSFVKH